MTLRENLQEELNFLDPVLNQLHQDDPKKLNESIKDFEIVKKLLTDRVNLLEEKDVYTIVGYGSLLNDRSRVRTLTPKTLKYDTIHGWRRIFNLRISNGTCLNVEPYEGAIIDAAIMEVDAEDMFHFILREIQYDLVNVKTDSGTDAIMVVAKQGLPQVVPNTDTFDQTTAPRLDYINACVYGINELNPKNIFLNEHTVLHNGQPLVDFIKGLLNPDTLELIEYYKTIDSNY